MAKHYGALVGAIKQLAQFHLVDKAYEKTTDTVLVRDYFTCAATPFTDTIQLGIFGWETVINPNGDVWFDALGANTTLSVGDVTYPTALVNATDTHTAAGSVKISKALTLDLYFAPLWQALGYATLAAAKAIGPQCELLATINTANATGKVAWQLSGQPRV